MKNVASFIAVLSGLFLSGALAAQCYVDTCVTINEIDTVSLTFEIEGAINDDLANPNQGVCKIKLNFQHEFLGDLQATLISPAGQRLQLLGPNGNFGLTQFSEWDVCFIPSTEVPIPDPGFLPRWSNNQLWGAFAGTYTGTYHPFVGELEDLNLGPVNGTWKLEFIDRTQFYTGKILGFQVEFCDSLGVLCQPCKPNSFNIIPSLRQACEGAQELLFRPNISPPELEDTVNYQEVFVVLDSSSIIMDTGSLLDLRNAVPGRYQICGLSFYLQHVSLLPGIGENWLRFRDSLEVGLLSLCAGVSDCIYVEVLPAVDSTFIAETICQGDSIMVGDTILKNTGEYVITTTSALGCDSIITVDLTAAELDLSIRSVDTINCTGDPALIDISTSRFPDGVSAFWSTDNGKILREISRDSIEVTAPGRYTFRIEIGRCTDSLAIDVPKDSSVPVIRISGDTLNCHQDTIILSGETNAAQADYAWYFNNSLVGRDSLLMTSVPGDYSLEVIDMGNGCMSLATYKVIIDTTTVGPVLMADSITCRRDSAMVLLSNFGEYENIDWLNPATADDRRFSFFIDSATVVIVRATMPNGCTVTDSISVVADTTRPSLTLTADTLNCISRLAEINVFSNVPALDYEWSGPQMFSSSLASDLATLPGVYRVLVTSENGCQSEDSILVLDEKEAIELRLHSDSLDCRTVDPLIWYETTLPLASTDWRRPNGNFERGDSIRLTNPGWYVLEYESLNGCIYRDSLEVLDHRNTYNVVVLNDTIDCETPNVTISAVADTSGLLYYWIRGLDTLSTDSTVQLATGGAFILIVDDGNGCLVRDSFIVSVDTTRPQLTIDGGDTLNCRDTVIHLTANTSSSLKEVAWYHSGGRIGTSVELEVSRPGWYRADVIADNGCQRTDSIEIFQDDISPVAQINSDTLTCLDTVADLQALGGDPNWSYLWLMTSGDTLRGEMTNTREAGSHQLLVINNNNYCRNLSGFTVEIDTAIEILQVRDTSMTCHSDSIVLMVEGATGNFQYLWSGPAGFTSFVRNPGIAMPGNYSLVYSGRNGCEGQINMRVEDDRQPPMAYVTGDTFTCDRRLGQLSASLSQRVDTFYWLFNGRFFSGDSIALTGMAGRYDLVVTGSNLCSDTLSVQIGADTIPVNLELQADGVLGCEIAQVNLSAITRKNQGQDDLEYYWSSVPDSLIANNLNESEITVTREGLYLIQILNRQNGCWTSDSLYISSYDNDIGSQIVIKSPSCDGRSDGEVIVDSIFGGFTPYMVNFNGLGYSSKTGYGYLRSGSYSLVIRDSLGCLLDTLIDLDADSNLMIHAGPDTCVVLGDTIRLQPVPANLSRIDSIVWHPAIDIRFRHQLFAEVFPRESRFYSITAIDSNGCIARDEVFVKILDDVRVYVPNAFTPNGDGLNDFLEVFTGRGVKAITQMTLFDRWGNMVFNRSGTNLGSSDLSWDGNFNGEPCLPGVYAYMLYVTRQDDSRLLISGDITLLR